MLKNYIKTAMRSLLHNKTYSFLNIFGLAVGIACAAFIFLWVEDEVNFDTVNVKKDRLYIARVNQKYDTYVSTHSSTPGLMGPAMLAEIPGVANTCRTTEELTPMLFSNGDKPVYASGKYADPSIFSMFTLPFVEGNAKSAFSQLHALVITQKAAKKFFGINHNVVGKTIRVDNKQDYVISGVIKDIPANATMQFEWIAPYEIYALQSPWIKNWGNSGTSTYVELKPGIDPETINKPLYNYIQRRYPVSISHAFLFSMNDWHLYNQFENGKKTGGGRIQYVHLFSLIAWIILFIACINFMNLATARSEKRAREVGVRKVLGAGKKILIAQFIGEAIFMALLGAVVALVIVALMLPAFNILVEKQLLLGLNNPMHIVVLLAITLVCGIVAGSYPAFYLSSFNPVFVFKGLKLKNGSAAFIRKSLVVLQFTISIVLIISTVIIYQQIQHGKNRSLGFNKDNLLVMDMQGDIGKSFNTIKQDLINTGVVEDAALADHSTLDDGNNTDRLAWAGKPPGSKVLISGRNVTPEFFATTKMKIIEGRGLQASDSLEFARTKNIPVVITQSMAKLMGNDSAIGKMLYNEGDQTTKLTVVGVVNNYVYGNMYGKSDPVIFIPVTPVEATLMYARLNPHADVVKAIEQIKNVMVKDNPAYPFQYSFVDDQFNRMFWSEMLISKLSRVFAALAIVISCLGLFGLAAYTAERRKKEIGIRKVLGATVAGLAKLLSLDFLQLVGLSCLVAFPISYWIMQDWLKSYDYRIVISGWVFVLAGSGAILIALLTISFQSVKAALSNPVKSLKSE